MRATTLFSILLGAFLTGSVMSARGAESRKLSLEECIAIALEHNFDVQIERYNPQTARFTLAGSYGVYDPVFSFSGQHDYETQPGGIDSQGRIFTGSEMDANTFNTGLNGLLPWGLNYNLGGSLSDRYGTKPGAITDPTSPIGFSTNYFTDGGGNPVTLISTNYGTVPTRFPFDTASGQVGALQLSQPLLRNFWIDQPRYVIYANKKNLRIQESNFRDQLMATITDVETAYFNLVYSEDSVKVQQQGLQLAERLLAENKKRVEVGALAPLDEQQAQSQAATSRATLIQAEANRDSAERTLKDLVSDNYTNDWADVQIVPTDRLLAVPQHFDLQESWRRGIAQSPGLAQQRLTLDIRKYNVRYQRNQLLPQVNVIGSVGFNGSGPEISGALDQIRGADNPFWTVGGQLSVPLSRTTERNNYKAAVASKEQQSVILKQLEQKTLVQIENDIARARANFEQVEATRQARIYAEAALDAEQKKLENGKSTTFEVLQLQQKLTEARAQEVNSLAQYNIALATLAFHEGSTFERHKVMLDMSALQAAPAQLTPGRQ